MHRRQFLAATLAAAALPAGCRRLRPAPEPPALMTVRGPVSTTEAGLMLPHEHVMSIFGGPPVDPPVYDEAALTEAVVPYLHRLRERGAGTLVDATGAYFGRAPHLLRQFSRATGLHILTNTGYYGAADDRYIPAHAYDETAGQIAARWTGEWERGIDGTGIRPGFIKVGIDGGPLSEIDAKLVRAGAITHRSTGLTLAVHTGDNPEAAARQLAILAEEGVAPGAWVWIHAHHAAEAARLFDAARAGAWLSLDGLRTETLAHHLGLVQALAEQGFLDRILLSHDGNSYPGPDRAPRPYHALFTDFLPRLRAAGFSEAHLYQLTHANPHRAYAVARRLA